MAARQFFENLREPVEPFEYSSQVRYFAKQYIRRHHGGAISAIQSVANNGLKFEQGRYSIRARKIDRRIHGGVEVLAPSPGISEPMQLFYRQRIAPLAPLFNRPELNLMFLWDNSRGFVELFLSCPAGGTTRRSVVEYWWRRLNHPADSLFAPPAPPSDDNSDLGYQRRFDDDAESDTGTENG